MEAGKAKSINRINDYLLKIVWDDRREFTVKLEDLRSACPCAHCKTEREKRSELAVPVLGIFQEGMNELNALEPVGNYALKPVWGDGHDTGIWDWEYLLQTLKEIALSDDEIKNVTQ